MWPTDRVNNKNNYFNALCNLYNAWSLVSNDMVVPEECTHCIWQQVLRPHVQVLQTCTRVQIEYKSKYQVLHAYSHHQSPHCITFAMPSMSCLLYLLYTTRILRILIRRISNELVSLILIIMHLVHFCTLCLLSTEPHRETAPGNEQPPASRRRLLCIRTFATKTTRHWSWLTVEGARRLVLSQMLYKLPKELAELEVLYIWSNYCRIYANTWEELAIESNAALGYDGKLGGWVCRV